MRVPHSHRAPAAPPASRAGLFQRICRRKGSTVSPEAIGRAVGVRSTMTRKPRPPTARIRRRPRIDAEIAAEDLYLHRLKIPPPSISGLFSRLFGVMVPARCAGPDIGDVDRLGGKRCAAEQARHRPPAPSRPLRPSRLPRPAAFHQAVLHLVFHLKNIAPDKHLLRRSTRRAVSRGSPSFQTAASVSMR